MTVPNNLPKDTPTRAEMSDRVGGSSHGPCEWCVAGFHYMCTGVGCYECPKENHRRVQGVSMLGKSVQPKEEEDGSS